MQSAPGFGGYTETARHLEKLGGKPVTRQQVYVWHMRRLRNHFPRRHGVACADGKVRQLFRLEEAERWLRGYWQLDGTEPVNPVSEAARG